MTAQESYLSWLHSDAIDEKTRNELESIANDPQEIEERFYTSLAFGTAGLRGILGAGTNRMNDYVVRHATQGLADYMLRLPGAKDQGVCIAYDSRLCSDTFARESACVLAANGIRTYLFESLRSVPQLSFTLQHLGCMAGIVITASHNPSKYNGYKVYWSYGGQCAPEQADAILACIEAKPMFSDKRADFDEVVAGGIIRLIGKDEDEAYYRASLSVLPYPDLLKEKGKDLSIVYTPLHGTGNVPVREMLARAGVTNVTVVPEQAEPDGHFPTVSAPNPEMPDAFRLAFQCAEKTGATVCLATDPDADRLGIAVRRPGEPWTVLTGNQIGCLLAEHLLSSLKAQGKLPENGALIKSLVSTKLADAIAARYGVTLMDVLTGFRFIGEKIDEFTRTKEYTYLFGFEESYGFLAGGFARDKDAILSAVLAAEMCVCFAERNMTLADGLAELYQTYGFYKERVTSYTLEGKAGIERIQSAMKALRLDPVREAGGLKVLSIEDYATGKRTTADGAEEALTLPASDVIRILLENNAWAVVRPSGTEPKLKLYTGGFALTESEVDAQLEAVFTDLDTHLKKLLFN